MVTGPHLFVPHSFFARRNSEIRLQVILRGKTVVKFGKYQGKQTTSILGELREDGENKLPISLSIKKVKPVFDGVTGRQTGYERTEVHVKKGGGTLELRAEEVPRLLLMLQQIDAQLNPASPKKKLPRKKKRPPRKSKIGRRTSK